MDYWQQYEASHTIKDFEYTKRAVMNINQVLMSKDFECMEADSIFQYLSQKMEIICFCDYLKRYIFEQAQLEGPFNEVPDETYYDIIEHCFKENNVPASFTSTTVRRSSVIKNWLTAEWVKRGSVFVLAFVLRMTVKDVSLFLTKVIKEDDFNFSNEEEVIYWYCLREGLTYEYANRYLNSYHKLSGEPEVEEKTFADMHRNPEMYLHTEANLMQYLHYLKVNGLEYEKNTKSYKMFLTLYDQCRKIIADIYNKTEQRGSRIKNWTIDQIQAGDIEKMLCAGIPKNASGNLERIVNVSMLPRRFQQNRMSRQHVNRILKGTQVVHRTDLITLLFFIYAESAEYDVPTKRFSKYIDEINKILIECHMMGIYPTDPYDAYILMCLLSESPLEVYTEVWEMAQ